MSSMVYLMTSLPSLTFGQVPPISIDEFNHDAKSQLSARHYRLLESVDIQKMNESEVKESSIASLFSELQEDLTEIRNARTEKRQPSLGRLPKAVISGNPLQREENIIKWQWEELDTIEVGKTFTFTEVLVYKLKLQLLIRMNSFNEARGAEILASVVDPQKNKEGK
ncbi:DUF2764 family protein [Prolixibacteraceae bacterium JC049]|nr:DUF2764 family protein [Prolixibacteraceae bacterium JC049]